MSVTNTIFTSMKNNINALAAEGLTDLGLSFDEAVKLVEENDFDIITSSEQNPVAQF
jgi:hypothetical protein